MIEIVKFQLYFGQQQSKLIFIVEKLELEIRWVAEQKSYWNYAREFKFQPIDAFVTRTGLAAIHRATYNTYWIYV